MERTIEELKLLWAAPREYPITCANPAPWQICDVKIDVDPLKVWIRGEGSRWFRMDECFVNEKRDVEEFCRMQEERAKQRKALPFVKMIDISTGHITQSDSELLGSDAVKEGCGPFVVYPYDYGWFIPTPPRNKDWGEEVREIENFGFSPAFRDLITRCQDEGVNMIRLDQDADHVDNLPRFEW